MTEPLLLGLDLGTTNIKGVLVGTRGEEVAVAAQPTPFAGDGGRAEMGVDDLLAAVTAVISELREKTDERPITGVGVAGMAESGAPFDGAGRPLAPIIGWHDGRGASVVASLEEHFGPQLSIDVGQPVRTVFSTVKLGWLVSVRAGIRRWLGVPEVVLHALTGTEATEFSLAARTGAYHVAGRRWMPEVIEFLGLDDGVFPAIVAAGDKMGAVSPGAAAWSGLPPGVPVTIAGHDHLAGMAGAGVDDGDLANSVGTAETIVARCPTLPDIPRAVDRRVAITLFPGGEEWAALVSGARPGPMLAYRSELLRLSPQQLDALAEKADPADVAAVVATLGDSLGAGEAISRVPPGALWAGLLQILTDRTVDAYKRLTEVIGPRRRMVIFGGGSNSRPWVRAKATALPLPVVTASVRDAVARGAALYAGVAAGWWTEVDEAPRPGVTDVQQ